MQYELCLTFPNHTNDEASIAALNKLYFMLNTINGTAKSGVEVRHLKDGTSESGQLQFTANVEVNAAVNPTTQFSIHIYYAGSQFQKEQWLEVKGELHDNKINFLLSDVISSEVSINKTKRGKSILAKLCCWKASIEEEGTASKLLVAPLAASNSPKNK